MTKRILIGLMVFVVMAGLLIHAGTADAAEDRRHPELQKFESEGGRIEFLGHALGLDGWLLLTKDGRAQYAYTSPEGGLVLGMLVNPDGTVETANQLKAYKAKMEGAQESLPGADKGASKAEQLYAAVEKSNWVALGNKDAPYLYMFMNVSCEHCQAFWKDLQRTVEKGNLQVRFVPFGKLAENNEGGAALLSVPDPAAAWQEYLAGKTEALGKDKISPGALDKVAANTALAEEWRLKGTPFTLYRKVDNGTVLAVVGRPANVMLVLADLLRNK